MGGLATQTMPESPEMNTPGRNQELAECRLIRTNYQMGRIHHQGKGPIEPMRKCPQVFWRQYVVLN